VKKAVPTVIVLAVLAVLALPAGAMANPVMDCAQDGDLDKQYSNSELRHGLNNIPGDLDEYSNCRDVLAGAIASGSDKGGNRPSAGGGGGGGVSGDASSLPASEQAARTKDTADLASITANPEDNPPSVDVGGENVKPGSNGLFDLASASNDLPVPLLVALVALALVAMVGGLVALRERVPALARIPLLSKIPTPRVSFPRFRR
jgi:hypothetical protein